MDAIRNLSREFSDFLKGYNLSHNVFPYDTSVICVEIHWGDWKHDHLATDWCAEQFFRNKGLTYNTWYEVTADNGSDTYSANRYYQIEQ